MHPANIDIQYITDEYSCAEYVCDYCTKNEGGLSNLLQNINEEALQSGEEAKLTLNKLIKCLDKGREVPVQEAVFRACGLPLTKFSSIVKFINTVHPERRDGLLKNKEELDSLGMFFYDNYVFSSVSTFLCF